MAISLLASLVINLVIYASCSYAAEPASDAAALGIQNYMQNPEKYPGTIEVEGVVSQAILAKHLFVLIDMEEYKNCKSVTCSLLRLPIAWEGALPAVYDIVRVKGAVGKRDGKSLFIAKEFKKVGQANGKK